MNIHRATIGEQRPVLDDHPEAAPFVLSRPDGTVLTSGRTVTHDSASAAAQALRSGSVETVVGALPFDPEARPALWSPSSVRRTDGPLHASAPPLPFPKITVDAPEPSTDEHLRRLRSAIEVLAREDNPLDKVVLARALRLVADEPVSAIALLDRLVARDSLGNGFCVDLTDAGADYVGAALVGSSPELLVRRRGTLVECHPLAGSAPRHTDPSTDTETGAALLRSTKNLREHAFVVEQVRDALAPLCERIDVPNTPELTSTPKLWHLGTPITAIVRDPAVTALDLAIAMHPTPAICGTPTMRAAELIRELEDDRGFYAGAVGWADTNGDGEWMVSIRCAQLSADRRALRAYAGGGIIAESDPDAELAETSTKLGTMLAALGISES